MDISRRDFIKRSSIALTVSAGFAGCGKRETAAPRASGLFSPGDLVLLNKLGDVLVPGAAAAGLVDFLETQLGKPPEEALLTLRYLGVPPPYRDFYLPALAAVGGWIENQYGASVESLTEDQLNTLVADLAANKPGDWGAPPAGFFYFVLRADAVDVVYGTRSGFAGLQIPYMAHIEPQKDW